MKPSRSSLNKVSIYLVNQEEEKLHFADNLGYMTDEQLFRRIAIFPEGSVVRIFGSEFSRTYGRFKGKWKEVSGQDYPASHEVPKQAWF